jgi:hypothetical protein
MCDRHVRFVPKADISPPSIRSTRQQRLAASMTPSSALAVIATKMQRQWIFESALFCQYDNLFRNNPSHSILAVAQTKEAFASNLKRWMDLR